MRRNSIIILAFTTVCLAAGCGSKDDTEAYDEKNISELAFSFYLGNAETDLRLLQILESGNTEKAKKVLRVSLLSAAPMIHQYAEEAAIPESERNEAKEFAKSFLSYLRTHKDEIDPRSGSAFTEMGLNGLYSLLSGQPERESVLNLARELDIDLKDPRH